MLRLLESVRVRLRAARALFLSSQLTTDVTAFHSRPPFFLSHRRFHHVLVVGVVSLPSAKLTSGLVACL